MTHRIYTLTAVAKKEGLNWDEAIARDEIETVEEFDTYAEAVDAYENGGYDPDLYGAE